MKTIAKTKQAFRNFHRDERGLEALQIVMILGIAAVVLLFVKAKWPSVKDWADTLINSVTSFTEGS